jgi:hypothetical protein
MTEPQPDELPRPHEVVALAAARLDQIGEDGTAADYLDVANLLEVFWADQGVNEYVDSDVEDAIDALFDLADAVWFGWPVGRVVGEEGLMSTYESAMWYLKGILEMLGPPLPPIE